MFQLSGKVSSFVFSMVFWLSFYAWCIPAGQDNSYIFSSPGCQETSSWSRIFFASYMQLYLLPMDMESCGVILNVFFPCFLVFVMI